MPPPTAAAEEGGSPRREEQVAPPAPPPSASSGNPLANVTSSLRRAGTQVKRLGRKILAETSSVLPGGYQSKDRAESGDGSGPNDRRDEDVDGADGASPGRKTAPRHRPRYLDLGPLDPRQSFLSAHAFADSADPPEGYVNVWQGNFRRWQKRWRWRRRQRQRQKKRNPYRKSKLWRRGLHRWKQTMRRRKRWRAS